jgi:hypothetical protein
VKTRTDTNFNFDLDLLGQFKQSLVKDKVGVVKFFEDYCNKPLYPRQRVLMKLLFLEELDGYEEDVLTGWIRSSVDGGDVEICPMIRERVDYLRERDYPHFTTIQLIGGRRSGKGFMTAGAIAKKIYDLIQLDHPAQHYGFDADKDIFFTIVADSQEQAKTLQYKDTVEFLLSCKPLVEGGYVSEKRVLAETMSIYTPYDLRKIAELQARGIRPTRDMAGIKVKAFAKNARTIRGTTSIGLDLDEFAHFVQGASSISDTEVMTAAKYALQQFSKDRILFANSSPYTEIGEFFQMYKESKDIENGFPAYPETFMLRWPSWESYIDWETDKKFSVAQINPPWLDEEMAQEEKKDPEKFSVEVRSNFAKVIDAFLNPGMVDRMYDPSWAERCLGKQLSTTYIASGLYTYKGHSDPSQTTANFGIAIGHLEEAIDPETEEKQFHVVFDLINAWYPEDYDNHVIDWIQIMPDFITLLDQFRPQEFTFDQFNSAYPIQQLNQEMSQRRITGVRVFEKTATPKLNMSRAENFKAALNLGRVHAPFPQGQMNERALALSMEELKHLQLKNGKVDKQSIGAIQTKDIADCIMEVVDHLLGEYLNPIFDRLGNQMEIGAHGGYSIGGRMQPYDPWDQINNFYDRPQSEPNVRARGRRDPRRR